MTMAYELGAMHEYPPATESGAALPMGFIPGVELCELPPPTERLDGVRLTAGVVRALVKEEAMRDLSEVTDLAEVRTAVRETYNLDISLLSSLPSEAALQPLAALPQAELREQTGEKDEAATRESVAKHKYSSRGAQAADIETLVDVDIAAFDHVYKDYGMTPEELRADLVDKFTGRFEKLGPDWIRVFERDGQIMGFMTCCPTSKSPEEFESWEQTTDDGTLETTYDPNGKNIYIVSLSMLPGASKSGRNMLFTHQIGQMLKGGYERFFFESRLPGLDTWVRRECAKSGQDPDLLSKEEEFAIAEEYFKATKTVKGKELPLDHLLRIYTQVGCTFPRLVADAYVDAQSRNFGAVGIYENPLPQVVRNNRLVRGIAGGALQAISRSYRLTGKLF